VLTGRALGPVWRRLNKLGRARHDGTWLASGHRDPVPRGLPIRLARR